jgi:ParB/RepB/Spo0J family partition protein
MVTKTKEEEPLGKIYEIPLTDIRVSHNNVRESHANATKDLDELAASIKKHGLLQPVVLIGEFGKPQYELISGQRRYLAHAQILKRHDIRAVFAAKKLSKTEAVIRSLVENLQRVELEYADTAKAVTFLYKELGDEKEVQKSTGLSLRTIRDFILVEARATPKMKALIKERKVSPADVKRAMRAAQDNLRKAQELLDLMMKFKPSGDQKRRIVSYGQQHKGASAENIFNEAVRAQVEQNIIVTLPPEIRQGLVEATKSLRMDAEELAAKVLSDWLRAQGFVS